MRENREKYFEGAWNSVGNGVWWHEGGRRFSRSALRAGRGLSAVRNRLLTPASELAGVPDPARRFIGTPEGLSFRILDGHGDERERSRVRAMPHFETNIRLENLCDCSVVRDKGGGP